jgi:hypothetical protein
VAEKALLPCGALGAELKSHKTLAPYRNCPCDTTGLPPCFSLGSFGRSVCSEPVRFSADAVIYLWDLNRPWTLRGQSLRGWCSIAAALRLMDSLAKIS